MSEGRIDMTPENTYIVSYPNDLFDGIIWEDDNNYAFISAHTEGYNEILNMLDEMGVGYFALDETVDYDQPPHCWVIDSIANMVVATALYALEEDA